MDEIKGRVKLANRIDRIGEERINNFGSLMRITNYRNCNDIDVYFEKYNYTKEHVEYSKFKKGEIKCPYEARIYNKGYLGEGKYKVKINGKKTKCYSIWYGMLKRAYNSKFLQNNPTYIECEVYSPWLNFQVFGEWFENNFYKIEGEQISLDKDILCKGNKTYSPDTCVFVPQRINTLFVKCDKVRGDLPIGVCYDKLNKKYTAYCNVNGKHKTLGYYKNPVEAFQVYKNFKEEYIKKVAEEYKDKIPQKLYNAMIQYKIEIND